MVFGIFQAVCITNIPWPSSCLNAWWGCQPAPTPTTMNVSQWVCGSGLLRPTPQPTLMIYNFLYCDSIFLCLKHGIRLMVQTSVFNSPLEVGSWYPHYLQGVFYIQTVAFSPVPKIQNCRVDLISSFCRSLRLLGGSFPTRTTDIHVFWGYKCTLPKTNIAPEKR